jgi:hypothetical protein
VRATAVLRAVGALTMRALTSSSVQTRRLGEIRRPGASLPVSTSRFTVIGLPTMRAAIRSFKDHMRIVMSASQYLNMQRSCGALVI